MKRLFYFFIILFATTTSFANEALQLKAEKSYAEKKYKEAIDTYEAILKEGQVSYKLYYNLGNAYYKNKEIGKAIYNYELANKLQPNNQDILFNLKIANEKTIDKIDSRENFFVGVLKSSFVNSLSTNQWAWLSIFSLISTLSLGLLFFAANEVLFKRIGFFAGAFCFVVFIASMVLGNIALETKKETDYAIILFRESKVYEEPSVATKVKFRLHEGTKVNILEANENWTNIKLENGNEGWVKTVELGRF